MTSNRCIRFASSNFPCKTAAPIAMVIRLYSAAKYPRRLETEMDQSMIESIACTTPSISVTVGIGGSGVGAMPKVWRPSNRHAPPGTPHRGKTADNRPARARDQVVVSYQCFWDIAFRFRGRAPAARAEPAATGAPTQIGEGARDLRL